MDPASEVNCIEKEPSKIEMSLSYIRVLSEKTSYLALAEGEKTLN